MTISMLLEHLQKSLEKYGNLRVKLWDEVDSDTVDLYGLATMIGEDDKPESLLLCDEYLMETLSDVGG